MNDNQTSAPSPPLMTPLKCLNPDCKNPTAARGLCNSCYTAAARLVREGKITWETLEAKGKAIPKTYGAGHPGTTAAWLMEGVGTG